MCRSQTNTFIVQASNHSTEIQHSHLGHFFTFNTTVVKRQSTIQWIPVLISLNITYTPSSRRTCRIQTNTFILPDTNRSTEIQYPLLEHFFTFIITTVKRFSTFQWIPLLISLNISNIPKSRWTCRSQTDTFIVQ